MLGVETFRGGLGGGEKNRDHNIQDGAVDLCISSCLGTRVG